MELVTYGFYSILLILSCLFLTFLVTCRFIEALMLLNLIQRKDFKKKFYMFLRNSDSEFLSIVFGDLSWFREKENSKNVNLYIYFVSSFFTYLIFLLVVIALFFWGFVINDILTIVLSLVNFIFHALVVFFSISAIKKSD